MAYIGADSVRVNMPLFHSGERGSSPTSALQLRIMRCDLRRAIALNKLWHSRFPKSSYNNMVRGGWVHCYTAEYDEVVYAVAIWTRPIAANRMTDGYKLLELRRMAVAPDAPKNTPSRMLAIMRRMILEDEPEVIRLVSYQDTESHEGTIYKAAGWNPAHSCAFVSWSTHPSRPGKLEQSQSRKVRWELDIRP